MKILIACEESQTACKEEGSEIDVLEVKGEPHGN